MMNIVSGGAVVSADKLIQIAISLTTEKRIDELLDLILAEAIKITNCDGGTVYFRDEGNLHFHNVVTLSKNVHLISRNGEDVLPPVPLSRSHVCACSALDHELFNIPNVYESDRFDFTGAQRYDQLNSYRTQSMLVVPMMDENDNNIGVLQLINAMDGEGNIVPFDKGYESVISALTSLAAVSLNNRILSKAVSDILHSFVSVMVDAIDARTPYNATHTKKMVSYASRFMDWLDRTGNPMRFPPQKKDPFLMSVWLHDIGKLVVPLEIMNKRTRLGTLEEAVTNRMEVALLMEELREFRNPEEAEQARQRQAELRQASELISQVNTGGFISGETADRIRALGRQTCLNAKGESIPLLNSMELDALCVERGTLTSEERQEMNRHVVYTERFLSKMQFQSDYADVPVWAAAHHELLDGSGYPHHLKGGEIPQEVHLLTILDIYDALTSDDRPYKPPMPPERAFGILEEMCNEGKLDSKILSLFRESRAWERTDRGNE